MYLDILSLENKSLRKIHSSVLDVKSIRYDLIHQLIVWQQSKKRHPISNTKGISDVRGSTRKIYRQKGTGRARHGSVRGAQFVGGGIIFGPTKKRVYEYKVNKKVKKLALLNALALKCKNNSLLVYENLKVTTPKSKELLKIYYDRFFSNKVLFIDKNFDTNLVKSMKNIVNFNKVNTCGINVLDIINHDKICFSEEAFNCVINRFI